MTSVQRGRGRCADAVAADAAPQAGDVMTDETGTDTGGGELRARSGCSSSRCSASAPRSAPASSSMLTEAVPRPARP